MRHWCSSVLELLILWLFWGNRPIKMRHWCSSVLELLILWLFWGNRPIQMRHWCSSLLHVLYKIIVANFWELWLLGEQVLFSFFSFVSFFSFFSFFSPNGWPTCPGRLMRIRGFQPHSYVRHDSFICETWLTHMWDQNPRILESELTTKMAVTLSFEKFHRGETHVCPGWLVMRILVLESEVQEAKIQRMP